MPEASRTSFVQRRIVARRDKNCWNFGLNHMKMRLHTKPESPGMYMSRITHAGTSTALDRVLPINASESSWLVAIPPPLTVQDVERPVFWRRTIAQTFRERPPTK